jgi:hypothetical protein
MAHIVYHQASGRTAGILGNNARQIRAILIERYKQEGAMEAGQGIIQLPAGRYGDTMDPRRQQLDGPVVEVELTVVV